MDDLIAHNSDTLLLNNTAFMKYCLVVKPCFWRWVVAQYTSFFVTLHWKRIVLALGDKWMIRQAGKSI